MTTAVVLRTALIVLAVILAIGVAWWARKRPNRSAAHPDRVRMPRIVIVVGVLLVTVGLLLGLSAFTAPGGGADLTPMKIAAVVVFIGGALSLLAYRNWYVAPRADEVAFRSVLGRERVIAYADIAEHRMSMSNGQPMLRIRSSSGAKLGVNIRMYDMTPLLMAIDFKKRTGRWPLRGEQLDHGTGGASGAGSRRG
ncbi:MULTISPECIES: hypothetical protein [Bacteria]|uniref:hypothetical protein n=1 Tax=Bacteria TaxID=2 RepID=UPI003C7BBFD8